MAAYRYIKKKPRVKVNIKAQSLVFSSFFLFGGLFLLLLVSWPILSFEMLVTPKLSQKIISPIPENTRVLGVQTDLTYASNWFPNVTQKTNSSKITSYNLSIPKLNIKDATVIVGSDDLNKSLIQWGGTGLPGEYGNTVIFGHSVLPAFFDPKNYMTIFSTLPTLKEGDEVYIYADGITYRYVVSELKVIEPSDISVLEQHFDDSYLSLVTCVPPGTDWKRLVVTARMTKI